MDQLFVADLQAEIQGFHQLLRLVGLKQFYLFFFQAEDGIRDVERSRGLGDVYKRQLFDSLHSIFGFDRTNSLIDKGIIEVAPLAFMRGRTLENSMVILDLSLIHI